jgi:hypothetical protein
MQLGGIYPEDIRTITPEEHMSTPSFPAAIDAAISPSRRSSAHSR